MFRVNDFGHGGKPVGCYPRPLGCFRCDILRLAFQECEHIVFKVSGIGRGPNNFMSGNTSCTFSFEIELWNGGVLLMRLQMCGFAGDILAWARAMV